MADLLDMYKQGAFSKEDDTPEVEKEKEDESDTEKKDTSGVSVRQALLDADLGRDFFMQYLNLLIRKNREEASVDFRVDDLHVGQSEPDTAAERREKEQKFLTGRRKDFVKYVGILSDIIKNLGD